MRAWSDIYKKSLLLVLFLFLFFPILQNNLNFFEIKELKGSFEKASETEFIFSNWLNASFQETEEKFLEENFGLRNTLVRFNNQLRFDLFKKTTSKEAVFGKDGYFLGHVYIDAYVGSNFIGVQEILKKVRLIKELQDTLQAHGQIFLPVIAPNKVRVLKDLLPDGTYIQNATNYDVFIALFKKFKIKYIDFSNYFTKADKTSKYPLFTKYGIHWSSYGHTLAADSIINYLNYNYNLNAPIMEWKNNITLSDSLRDLDYDIGEGMNLLVNQLPSKKMAYPTISFKNTGNKKPSLLVIGDSFNFGLEKTDYQNQAFSDYKFLYYFKDVVPYTNDKAAIYKLNLKNEINNHKVILLLTTDNLRDCGWGFLEQATALLNGKLKEKDLEYTNSIHIMEFNVRNNADWFSKIKEKSVQEHLDLDSLVYANAKYVIDREILKNTPHANNRVTLMRESIKKDKKWMQEIKNKALQRGISVDSMTTLDALWTIEHSNQ